MNKYNTVKKKNLTGNFVSEILHCINFLEGCKTWIFGLHHFTSFELILQVMKEYAKFQHNM